MKTHSKTVIAVVGPTAVGKTAVGIQLAEQFKTEILSADSRQCYKELNVGVARPSETELQTIPHHFIASHSIHDEFTAADYESYALQISQTILSDKDQLVLAGGTGLYIRAFLDGLDQIPTVDAGIRQAVISLHAEKGIEGLTVELSRLDPRFVQEGEMKNPQRMMRALEVVMSTGSSILSYRTGMSKPRLFDVKWVGLELPREVLVDRIDKRVEDMMEARWLEEAKALFPHRNLNALQTVGYKELFGHLAGNYSLEEAVDRIKIATRQYAKRQMTWFRKNGSIRWFEPTDVSGIRQYLLSEDQRN
ncbi:MAG: tRNA (adenosine(37)-N6)-dimethylallyltransferase MiaA [Bacteroidota bacterium]